MIMLGECGTAEVPLLPDEKIGPEGINCGHNPDEWAKEWRSLVVMVWEMTGLGREHPDYQRTMTCLMAPMVLAWHTEDWRTYQSISTYVRRQISGMPGQTKASWWPMARVKGRA